MLKGGGSPSAPSNNPWEDAKRAVRDCSHERSGRTWYKMSRVFTMVTTMTRGFKATDREALAALQGKHQPL